MHTDVRVLSRLQLPGKHQSMVVYSSTLKDALCTQKLKFSTFTSFSGDLDKQRTRATPKIIFHERHLYNGKVHTTEMFE